MEVSLHHAGMALLAKIIKKDLERNKTHLDLSSFSLSSAQFKTLIFSVDGVDLFYMSTIAIDDVHIILTTFPRLSLNLTRERSRFIGWRTLAFQLSRRIYASILPQSPTWLYRNVFLYIGINNGNLMSSFFTLSRAIQGLIDTLRPLLNWNTGMSSWEIAWKYELYSRRSGQRVRNKGSEIRPSFYNHRSGP
jgi:hypothetical protein